MKIVEKADRIHLGSLVEDLKKGHFVIPDFQREFEWQPWDVLDFIKSIFMDYYVGTLLLWKGSKDNFNMLSCEPIYAFNGQQDPQHIVLDGQQRLTAIHYAFFQPEIAFPGRAKPLAYFLNIQAFLEDDFENAFWYDYLTRKNKRLLKDVKQQYERHIFPLGTMREGTWGTSDWIKGYRDYWNEQAEMAAKDEEGQKRRLLAQKSSNQAKDFKDYTDSKKMKIYVLQVMSILEQAYCSPKYLYYLVPESIKTIKKPDGSNERIVLVDSSEEFLDRWHFAINALKKAIKSLRSPRDFGAIQASFVPYPSIIPAFAAIKAFVDDSKAVNKLDMQTKIRKWYWASIFTNRYSSSVESTSAKDFQALKRWFIDPDDEPEMISDFISNYRNMDLVLDNGKGSAIYNAIFNLFVINGARDWSSFDLPEYDSLDDHHIVPHSTFHEKAGRSINSILNRTALSPGTNRHIIRNRMPNEYLKEMLENNGPEKVYSVLASHLISRKAVAILLRDPFEKSDYDEFLQVRLETILDAIDDQLIKDKVEIPLALKKLNDAVEEIELKLRQLLIEKSNGDPDSYVAMTPPHIREKVNKRIEVELKKKPGLTEDDFSSFSVRLKYFDLFEYYDTIVSKANWDKFEMKFKNKPQLESRFNQLSTLRNCIRHSRDITAIEKLDGEAAIAWFKHTLQ